MSVPMKKRRTNSRFINADDSVPADIVFADLHKKNTKVGSILRGLRFREELSQEHFAKKIGVSQSNLSKMEHGKRPVGKKITLRIEKAFDVPHEMFLKD